MSSLLPERSNPDRPRPRPSARPRPATAAGSEPAPAPAPTTPTDADADPDAGSGGQRLPVSEFLFHRPGAASPFGDDLQFPLPAGALSYRHS
jgi:hypothetical protein